MRLSCVSQFSVDSKFDRRTCPNPGTSSLWMTQENTMLQENQRVNMQLGKLRVYVRYCYFIINRCNLFLIALRWVYFHLNVDKFKSGHICVCFELKIMQYAWVNCGKFRYLGHKPYVLNLVFSVLISSTHTGRWTNGSKF